MIAGADPRIAVVGLGYVGLPLAVALADHFETIGFDIDAGRIAELRAGRDRTREIDGPRLEASSLRFASEPADVRGCDVFIVTVPTPVDANRLPDLGPVMGATRTVAGLIEPGRETIIVYESTVYPGVTEDLCGPELERLSGLRRGKDFFLGYSPERINPGDKEHTVERIMKVVAGENAHITARMADIYGRITTGGTFRAASIKVAEAGKVIENAQRDINIAFMNEITQIFARMDISIWDVLEAAGTKWNFLKFQPGLVGGHCIGVDPYYLSYRAQQLGHLPDVILSGRMTNDAMGAWVADKLHARCDGRCGDVLVMGLTFKEDVPDLRNSKVIDVIRRLETLGHKVSVHDPLADPLAAMEEYGLEMHADALEHRYGLVLVAVPHAAYKAMTPKQVAALAVDGGLVADLKGIWRHQAFPKRVERWSL